MKCPNCGAEVSGKFCEYCGTQLPYEMRQEQERLNKRGCPKCGSSNTTFRREKQGEIRGENGTAAVMATVGLCGDCGYTWGAEEDQDVRESWRAGSDAVKKRRTWLWVLGWIFMFPVPLTILLVRNKKMNVALKIVLIVVAWLAYFAIAAAGDTEEETADAPAEPEISISIQAESA